MVRGVVGHSDHRPGAAQAGSLPIADLKRYLRCDNCGERGHIDLSIVWADR
jgi:hypothetical protein